MLRHGLRVLFGVLVAVSAACSNASTPASPTPPPMPPPAATRVISLEPASVDFGDVFVGDIREVPITVRNSGTATLTISDVLSPPRETSGMWAYLDVPPGSTFTVPPGGTRAFIVAYIPADRFSASGTFTVMGDFTSGATTLEARGRGVGMPITLVGVVTDSVTRRPLSGVRVSSDLGAPATTDGNGFYAMRIVSGTVNLSYAATGYVTLSQRLVQALDSRWDISLVRQ